MTDQSDLQVDVLIAGAGTAGLMCAISAARAGATVLLVEKDERIGGTLHYTGGHMSAAGPRRQREAGIADTPDDHMADIMRISRETVREDLVRIDVDNAADTVDWLADHGFAFAPETPRIIYGHEPYKTARTYYGRDAGLSILEVLRAELDELRASGAITLWLNSPILEIHTDGGVATGALVLERGTTERNIAADAVVLATGGFASDAEMFAELEGSLLVSAANPASTGDGIALAREVGAGLQGKGTYLPTFGGLPDAKNPNRANFADRQVLTSNRPPLEIYVDAAGKRWIAEDEESIDHKERALTGVPNQTFWTIFDDEMLSRSTGDAAMILGREPDAVRAMANTRHGVHSAQTLEELAAAAGIDAAGLVATVERYNAAVVAGVDADFGRTHMPLPVAKAPYYAVRNHGITLITFVGLDIDSDMTVRAESGDRIEHLYAIGEIIGAGATCGNSFVSGLMITPALTFGRLLGDRLGHAAA